MVRFLEWAGYLVEVICGKVVARPEMAAPALKISKERFSGGSRETRSAA
jgi:hypothetical protein